VTEGSTVSCERRPASAATTGFMPTAGCGVETTPLPLGYETFRSSDQRKEISMSEIEMDEFGPVDYVVVEFPAGKSTFTGEMAAALEDLVNRSLVRLLDLLIIQKDADGSFEAVELSDLDDSEAGELRMFEKDVAELLAEDDVAAIAEAMEPGSVAGVLVWENSWAAPFASSIRRAGGQLIASGRIPIQAILAAIEEDEPVGSKGA
jgi:Family of unknown function (DUF6325)